jgi:hypothetical protein
MFGGQALAIVFGHASVAMPNPLLLSLCLWGASRLLSNKVAELVFWTFLAVVVMASGLLVNVSVW